MDDGHPRRCRAEPLGDQTAERLFALPSTGGAVTLACSTPHAFPAARRGGLAVGGGRRSEPRSSTQSPSPGQTVRGHSRTKSRYGSTSGGLKGQGRAGGRVRRRDLRRQLRRARGRARAGRVGASVLVIDRYEIGERPTSACGIPTEWLRVLDVIDVELQRFGELVVHTPGGGRCSTFPTRSPPSTTTRCAMLLWRECDATFEIAAVEGRSSGDEGEIAVATDRGRSRRRWSSTRSAGGGSWPATTVPAHQGAADARAGGPSAGPQRRPRGLGRPPLSRAGYGWCFPAGEERRIGACSYGPHDHVREGTDVLSADLGTDQVRYQGNWIPHRLRPPTEAGVFLSATRPASACR